MVEKFIEEIKKRNAVRQSLSELRKVKKTGDEDKKLISIIKDEETLFVSLLSNEDAKTRKNTALLIGSLGIQSFIEPIWEAYEREKQLFVKSSYLIAIKSLDYREYLTKLKDRLKELKKQELTDENKKHIAEEMHELTDMILMMEGVRMHSFSGIQKRTQVILLTNRNHVSSTMEQIEELAKVHSVKALTAGVKVDTEHIDQLLKIRTWREMLFLIPGLMKCPSDPLKAARIVAESDLLEFLNSRHKGEPPSYFRVELKSKQPLDKKSTFVKRFSSELERLTDHKLVNSTSNYELELRLVERSLNRQNSDIEYLVFLKLMTIRDDRFTYRKESIAASIQPSLAAVLVWLARDYMKEGARVLDPFCGVGTMLIERYKVKPADTSYGVDILGEAITKARENTEAAGQIIHLINKDFFDFEHEYLFDEIITNMPFASCHKSEEEIYKLYEKFFIRARLLLSKDGVIIMYSHNRDYVLRLAKENNYILLKQFEINQKEDTYLFIIK